MTTIRVYREGLPENGMLIEVEADVTMNEINEKAKIEATQKKL